MVNVYLLNVEKLYDEKTFNKYYKNLSARRKEKVDKLAKTEDKALCMGAGLLESYALGDDEIHFTRNNKPYTFAKHYNITHSGKMVAIAISDDSVGIDIEKIRPFNEKICDKCFTKREVRAMEECVSIDEGFTIMWTLKESFIKCVGKGLSLPLKDINIDFSNKGISIVQDISARKFHFAHYPMQGYKLSVCGVDKDFMPPENLTDSIII